MFKGPPQNLLMTIRTLIIHFHFHKHGVKVCVIVVFRLEFFFIASEYILVGNPVLALRKGTLAK